MAMVKTEPAAAAAAPSRAPVPSDHVIPPLEGTLEGCVGGFLAGSSRFCVRIASDGTLRGEVWRKRPTAAAAAAVNAASSGDKRRISEVDEVKAEVQEAPSQEQNNWIGNSHILIAHLAGSATYVRTSRVSTRQRARVRAAGAKIEPDTGDVACASLACGILGEQYCCRFDATKRMDHVDRHTVRCHLHIPADIQVFHDEDVKFELSLSAFGAWELPFKRQPRASSGSDGTPSSSPTKTQPQPTEGLFELVCVDPKTASADNDTVAMQTSRIYPLRPGKYEFKGYITYDVPAVNPTSNRRGNRRRASTPQVVTKDECIVSLRLFPDGTLRGTSCELVHPQVCPLYGSWQVNRIIYILDYHVRGAVGHFRYSGGVAEGDKLVGKWRNVDDGHADGFDGGKGEFELHLDQVRYDADTDTKPKKKAKQDNPASSLQAPEGINIKDQALTLEDDDDDDFSITALTTGHYELKGESTDADGYDYAFDFSMTLLPGGELRALCREQIFEQTHNVIGKWTRSSITYDQEYIVRREIGIYEYAGELLADGVLVQGHWRNAEARYATSKSEHGTFALAITSVARFWSPHSHLDFPRPFRQAVKCLLLCSSRSHALPGALWTHVLAFCHEKWFVTVEKKDVNEDIPMDSKARGGTSSSSIECKTEAVYV